MADQLVRQAVAQAKAGNKSEARKLATRAVKADPNNVSAWVVMAQVVGDRDKAIDCLQTVLKLEPGHPWATLHLSRLESGDSPLASPSAGSSFAVGESRPVAAKPEPKDDPDDPMRDLRQRAPSTFDLRVEDLGDYVRPIDTHTDVKLSRASLDPLAGTDDWQRPLSDSSRVRYDQVEDVLATDAKARRRFPVMILFVIVFVIMALGAVLIGAWAMGMLPF